MFRLNRIFTNNCLFLYLAKLIPSRDLSVLKTSILIGHVIFLISIFSGFENKITDSCETYKNMETKVEKSRGKIHFSRKLKFEEFNI